MTSGLADADLLDRPATSGWTRAVPGRLIVGWTEERWPLREQVLHRVGMTETVELEEIRASVISFPPAPDGQPPLGLSPLGPARTLLQMDGVRYVEPDAVLRHSAIPSDPRFGEQWGLSNTGQTVEGSTGVADADIDAPEAWDTTPGASNVVIGIIDEGIYTAHPDIAPNMWTNPGETPNNGLDDDSNGFIDDTSGWDFIEGDRSFEPTDESQFHGTFVASVAAGAQNGQGLSGVAPQSRLASLKVCDESGCPTSAITAAMLYAGRMGFDIANLSLGGPGQSTAERDAAAAYPETLYVAAAGNDGVSLESLDYYPCEIPSANVLCVAASDNRDALASFSNRGASAVDLAAPGVDILGASLAESGGSIQTVLADGFETSGTGWQVNGTYPRWAYTSARSFSGSWSLKDHTGSGNYLNDTATYLWSPPLNLAGYDACGAFYAADVAVEANFDFFYAADYASDGAIVAGLVYTGDSGNWFEDGFLMESTGSNGSRLLFGLETDEVGTDLGAWVDNVEVLCSTPGVLGADWSVEDGTSFAAPMVSGTAALLGAACPACSASHVRAALLDGVDPVSGMSGTTVSGGRLNARGALAALEAIRIDSGSVSLVQGGEAWIYLTGRGFTTSTAVELPSGVSEVSRNVTSSTQMGLRLTAAVDAPIGSFNLTLVDGQGHRATCTGCITISPASTGACPSMPGHLQVIGTAGDDVLTGTDAAEVFCPLEGVDWIDARGGNDVIFTGAGDHVSAGGGDDLIHLAKAASISGGPGRDSVTGAALTSPLALRPGEAIIDGVASDLGSIEFVIGSRFGDDLTVSGPVELRGGDGDDILRVRSGNGLLRGGEGDDTLIGGAGSDRLLGDAGDDEIEGAGGSDHIEGSSGRDRLEGGAGRDMLLGQGGGDSIFARDGGRDEQVNGGPGYDFCRVDPADRPSCEQT